MEEAVRITKVVTPATLAQTVRDSIDHAYALRKGRHIDVQVSLPAMFADLLLQHYEATRDVWIESCLDIISEFTGRQFGEHYDEPLYDSLRSVLEGTKEGGLAEALGSLLRTLEGRPDLRSLLGPVEHQVIDDARRVYNSFRP